MKAISTNSILNRLPVIIGALCIVLLGGFSISKFTPWLMGPDMDISGIVTGTTIDQSTVTLNGIAHHSKGLSMNGAPITLDPNGNFTHQVILQPGYNSIDVTAADKFGKTHREHYMVMVKENATPSFARVIISPINY